jgi:hypothetical protein
VQRERFFFNLGAVGAAVMLIVASIAFGVDAVRGIGLGIGIGGALVSFWFTAMNVHDRALPGHIEVRMSRRRVGLWTALAAAVMTVALWEAIQSAVFAPDPTRWLTFANGLVVATLAFAGLIAHELCTERVVHVLQIVDSPRDRT